MPRALSRWAFAGSRTSFPGGLAFRDGNQTVAVLFDPASIDLGSHRTALIPLSGRRAADGALSAPVPGWPLAVMTSVDDKNALASWARHNSCKGEAHLDDPPGPLSTMRYDGCAGGTEVGMIRIDGLGHTWTKTEVDTTAVMWQFFKSHRLSQ